MAWGAIAAAAAPIIGGIIGNQMAKGDKQSQKDAMKNAMRELKKIGAPPDMSKALILQELERQGVYTPELEQEIDIAQSELGQLQEDPRLREINLGALTKMQSLSKTGLGAEDRAALNTARREVQRDAEAKRQQIMQDLAAKGQATGGASLMAQLAGAQNAAELGSQQSDAIMAQAQARALQALGQSSQMASQMRGQDFDIAGAKARALDERNRMLAENSIARQSRNVSSLNQAQQMNLAEQQRIADYNRQMANQEKQRQAEATRANFQDKMSLAAAKAGQYQNQSNYYGQQAQNTAQSMAGIGSAIGGGISAYGQSKQNDALLDALKKK